MKITHISLCGPVTDYMSYQENILPKYHQKLGFDVSMIASKYIWNEGSIDTDSREVYSNEYGIKTIRLKNKSGTTINSRFKRYNDLYETLEKEKPDILFVHGVQFLDIKYIVEYLKKNPSIKVYVDNHADFSNSASNWLSKNILHKIIWRKMAHLIEPYTTKFYGVLPARVDFLEDVYKLPEDKVELLVMGADDEKVIEANKLDITEKIREEYDIKPNDFLIVTGGKIDNAKRQVLNLMEIVAKENNSNLKLIVYGSVIPEMQEEVYSLAKNDSIEYVGWIDNDLSYKLFSAANLIVFPGRHSVYWEQAAAMGVPMVIKYWEGTTHVDIGGNCKFIYEDEDLEDILLNIINGNNIYEDMLKNAQSSKKEQFLYSEIAKKSIN